MSPKLTFTIGSAITFLFLATFGAAPELFTMNAFPAAEGFALDVGITVRYLLAATIFGVSVLLFQVRNLERQSDQKKFLLASSIGFTVVCATIFYLTLVRGVEAIIPPIIATSLVAVLSSFSWAKIKP